MTCPHVSSLPGKKVDAANRIFELLYGELRSLAHGQSRRSDRTPWSPISSSSIRADSRRMIGAIFGIYRAGDAFLTLDYAGTRALNTSRARRTPINVSLLVST